MAISETRDDEDGRLLAQHFPASMEAVNFILAQPVDVAPGETDGRSPWVWVMLANGDWMVAVYPHGDTYEVSEQWREQDWTRAKEEGEA